MCWNTFFTLLIFKPYNKISMSRIESNKKSQILIFQNVLTSKPIFVVKGKQSEHKYLVHLILYFYFKTAGILTTFATDAVSFMVTLSTVRWILLLDDLTFVFFLDCFCLFFDILELQYKLKNCLLKHYFLSSGKKFFSSLR